MPVPGRRFAVAALICLHIAVPACGPRTVAVVAPLEPSAARPAAVHGVADDCAIVPSPGEPIRTVGIAERLDFAHAPRPANDGEHLLFRQLYETLIRVDCHGRAIPGLAASWQLDADGLTWMLTLREGARFDNGDPVTASDVRASWSRDERGDELRPHVGRLVRSVHVVNDRQLSIALRRYQANGPVALAHRDLAIAKRAAGSARPIGTRNLAIRFLEAPDPRDLLDRGVDLLVTRDSTALNYAATLPQFHAIPLAWQRTRLLLTPVPLRNSPAANPEAREQLAVDAVRGEARGAHGPFWWESQDCGVAALSSPARTVLPPRVVYDDADAASRDLAERLVGLQVFQRANGVSREAMAAALRRGTGAGYIVSVFSSPQEPCYELQELMEAAPWLDPQTMIVPLVETRLQAIVRRGAAGVTVEGDGGLHLAGQPLPDPR